MRKATILMALSVIALSAFYVAKVEMLFPNSLHYTRQGKLTWYSASNGGFQQYTNREIPEACINCHPKTLPNGTTVDAANYAPSCDDCHIIPGDSPTDAVCYACHGRQRAEKGLSGNPNPMVAERFRDVHRDGAGMTCNDCHTKDEIHGTGGSQAVYASMFEAHELSTTCDDCHQGTGTAPPPPVGVPEHATHIDDIECGACHASTVISCVNCHFESEYEHNKRFYGGPPMNNFVMLVNNTQSGKIGPASFQSLTWNDVAADPNDAVTFYGMGPFGPHTIKATAADGVRQCADCHNNANVQAYNSTGTIDFLQWDSNDNLLKMTAPGIIPVPEDYVTALRMDYVRFLNAPTSPVNNPRDPAEWEFLKTGTDDAHMLYATPLTPTQIAKMSIPIGGTDVDEGGEIPEGFVLGQNYPNPFNPATTIRFEIGREMALSLGVFDLTGALVETIFEGRRLAPGSYTERFDASDLASGIYLYRLQGDGFVITRAMTVVK